MKECKICKTENCWVHNSKEKIKFVKGLIRNSGYELIRVDVENL